jgi:phage tail sheath gpL-like
MPMQFNEIDVENRDPRAAIEFDTQTGVRALPGGAKKVLIVAQKTAAGSQAVNTSSVVTREEEASARFGAGSVGHRMARAALTENPTVDLTMVAVADDGAATPASETLTITGPATSDGGVALAIGNDEFSVGYITGDSATTIAAAVVAAIAARPYLPVTAANVAGVVTLTAKSKGVVSNGIQASATPTVGSGVTAVLSGTDGRLGGGTGVSDLAAALAAVQGRFHYIAIGASDSASIDDGKAHVDEMGKAEEGKGQVLIVAVDGALASLTSLANGRNHERALIGGINGCRTWAPEIAAAMAASMAAVNGFARSYDGRVLSWVKPPPLEKRWNGLERKQLINNGVTPLYPRDPDLAVTIRRAVTTKVIGGSGQNDYTLLDVGTIQGLDRVRDALVAMYAAKFAGSDWAEDSTDSKLPPRVATPKKVEGEIIETLFQLEEEGTVKNTTQWKALVKVEKVGTEAHAQIPADIIEGLHALYGRLLLVRLA